MGHLYERDGVFPPTIIEYMASLLRVENDEFMNQRLAHLPTDNRLHKKRRIMPKDLTATDQLLPKFLVSSIK